MSSINANAEVENEGGGYVHRWLVSLGNQEGVGTVNQALRSWQISRTWEFSGALDYYRRPLEEELPGEGEEFGDKGATRACSRLQQGRLSEETNNQGDWAEVN